jgi:hypothetical protein
MTTGVVELVRFMSLARAEDNQSDGESSGPEKTNERTHRAEGSHRYEFATRATTGCKPPADVAAWLFPAWHTGRFNIEWRRGALGEKYCVE